MQTWQFLYFLSNKYIKFKNWTYWSFYLYGRFETKRFKTRQFETYRFVNLKFCKPYILKPNVLKPDILKPDILKPDILRVYLFNRPFWVHFCLLLFVLSNYLHIFFFLGDEKCIHTWGTPQWNDNNCAKSMAFACEFPSVPSFIGWCSVMLKH